MAFERQTLTLACYHPAVSPVVLVLGAFWELGGSQWVRRAVEWSPVLVWLHPSFAFSPRAVPAPAGSLPSGLGMMHLVLWGVVSEVKGRTALSLAS